MKYRYYDPKISDDIVLTITDKAILYDYFDDWCAEMIKAKKSLKISAELCIQDWCAIHKAVPYIDDSDV